MKVNIYETVEISDQQRVELANVLDQEINRPKRQATRDEIKSFVWEHGEDWEGILKELFQGLEDSLETGDDEEDEVDEDLLGDGFDEEDLI